MKPVLGAAGIALALVLCGAPSIGGVETVVRVLLADDVTAVPVTASSHVGEVEAAASGSGLRLSGVPVAAPLRVASGPAGSVRAGTWQVRGAVVISRSGSGRALRVVNHIGLEDYIAGILGRELYPGWEPETLKAQAIVARTYALHELRRDRAETGPDRGFDLQATTANQAYGGLPSETASARRAVSETHGQVLTHRGEPILAVYHSASGGRTASSEEVWGQSLPYLGSVAVADEQDSPDTYWRASISRTKLGRALSPLGVRLGELEGLEVAGRTGSGRARDVTVRGRKRDLKIDARDLRRALGMNVIRSTLFEIRREGPEFVFVGSGHGHGVGLSQWGAQAMAKRGASHREILEAFYPGTDLADGWTAQ